MKSITRIDAANLILFFSMILGAIIRFTPTSMAGFAVNDGGMFAVMIDDLKTSNYVLPRYTNYNSLNIPYAYPPLGFYLGRSASDLTDLPALEIVRWIPAFFASLTIPAFFLLSTSLLKTRFHAAVATLFFALMPRAFSWLIMGGGLTRGPGWFFMLLTCASVVRLYKEHRTGDIFWTGLFGSMVVLSHPEAAVHTAAFAVFFWLMLGRTRKTLLNSFLVAVIVLILTSPWWLTVISQHGILPIISAIQTSQKFLSLFHLIFFSFTEEIYATPIAILGLIGIGLMLTRREFLLPCMLVLPFLIEGRSALYAATIPLAMLAAMAFDEVILPGLRSGNAPETSLDKISSVEMSVLIYSFAYLIFSTFLFCIQISSTRVYVPDREAMQWVSQNTALDARFLVMTGASSIAFDPVQEWFPSLARRNSVYTVQGSEWIMGNDFARFLQKAGKVQTCVSESADCLLNFSGLPAYDFIYISKKLRADNYKSLPTPETFPFFIETLRNRSDYRITYETTDVIIFQKH